MIGACVIWACGFLGSELLIVSAVGSQRADRMSPDFVFGLALVWVAITVAVRLGRETP